MDIPHDENGNVLLRMRDAGDRLDRPRIVNFCFAFPRRDQAIQFAASVDEVEYEVCISRYEEKSMWQAIVKKHMIPDHTEITRIEVDLGTRAAAAGGFADGWVCMRLTE